MSVKTFFRFFMTGVMATSLLSCDDIYDDPNDFPLPQVSAEQTYQNLNCTLYTNWVYINLHTKDSVTLDYLNEDVPIDWDIALHRYDVKTNGGAGVETSFTSLDALKQSVQDGEFARPADDQWQPDVLDSITVDMSHMMEGYLIYAPSSVNVEIGKWLNLDMSQMPPIYTPSGKVYLVRLADNTVAALLFTGYSNPSYHNAKGYISFDYIYPVIFNK